MIHAQNQKSAVSIVPKSINGDTENGTGVDCRGFHYAHGVFAAGAIGAAMTALKLQESDNNSDWSDVTGGGFTAPGTGNANGLWSAFIDLRPRKRYLRWVATAGAAATLIHGVFHLSRAEESPSTATERGVVEAIII